MLLLILLLGMCRILLILVLVVCPWLCLIPSDLPLLWLVVAGCVPCCLLGYLTQAGVILLACVVACVLGLGKANIMSKGRVQT